MARGGLGEAAPVLFCGKGQGLSPGHLFPRICPDSLCVICDKMDCRLFLQESEGFGDRLFLKQRMSLLSQMTSTPIDCLFQVRHPEVRQAQVCRELSILPCLQSLKDSIRVVCARGGRRSAEVLQRSPPPWA